MNVKQIEDALTYFNPDYPQEAMEAAIENREEIIPVLLNGLDYAYEQKKNLNRDYMLHHFGIYLLGQFREKNAFPKLVRFLEMNIDEIDWLLGDILTEGFDQVLCSTFNGDLEALKKVIENNSLDFFARQTALLAYGLLYLDGVVCREEFVSYLRGCFHKPVSDGIFQAAIHCGYRLQFHELIPEIRRAYERGEADSNSITYDEVIDDIFSKKSDVKVHMDDAIGATNWWSCFNRKQTNYSKAELRHLLNANKPNLSNTKVGRNDPCPCGSGKKYKKCCLNKGERLTEYEVAVLRSYPSMEKDVPEGQVAFSDYYDEEAIEIDRYAYLGTKRALGHLMGPNRETELIQMKNLLKAYELLMAKMKSEGLESFSEFDEKYQVHYFALDWVVNLSGLLEVYNAHDQVKSMPVIEALREYDR